jgi:hypothetical protein
MERINDPAPVGIGLGEWLEIPVVYGEVEG